MTIMIERKKLADAMVQMVMTSKCTIKMNLMMKIRMETVATKFAQDSVISRDIATSLWESLHTKGWISSDTRENWEEVGHDSGIED